MTATVYAFPFGGRKAAAPLRPEASVTRAGFQRSTGYTPEEYLRHCVHGRIPSYGLYAAMRFEAELLAPEYAELVRNVKPLRKA